MTVPAQATLFNESVANGVTTSFPYQFMIASADDLTVELDGIVTTTGFSVTGVGSATGGTIVFSVAPANGVTVLRYLNPILKRDTDYQQLGDFNADVVDSDFDRIWLAIQKVQYDRDRSIKMPVGTVDGPTVSDDRENKVLGFDAIGDLALIPVQAGTSLLDLAGESGASFVGFKLSLVGAAVRTALSKLQELPSARDMGAVLDGVTDDTAALQKCLDANRVFILDGKARITSDLIVDPIRNRNCGFVSPSMLPSRYPYTTQTGGPAWAGTQESIIFYDGAASTSACCIRASAEAVGTEPVSTFDNTIWGFVLEGVTLDANNKAGFGLYGARVQDIQIRRTKTRGATVAGMSINGTYSGSIESVHCYLNPGRGFELGAADQRWGWTAQDKVNALYIRDLHADANGSGATFREANPTLCQDNCGVFFGPHRGVALDGVVSENNFGANIVYAPSGYGNSMRGVYTELGCKYAPGGAGTDAISLGYATQQWGVIFVGIAAASHNRIEDAAIATDRIWLTGTSPTAAREEGAFELYNVALAGGITADWSAYRLINCAVELESITGSQPAGAMTIKGGLQFGAGTTNLDYYDFGTWTPAFAGTTTPGSGWAYSVQAADWTRIGRHVFFTGRITLSAVSSDAVGQIAVTGFPFTVRNANNANSAVNVSNVTNMTTAIVSMDGAVTINNTRFTLQKRTAAAASASSVVLADLSATTSITFSGHFTV